VSSWVLWSRAYRESSALVEVFSESHGRISVVAKGARGPKSRLRPILQPFTPLQIGWLQSTSELFTLIQAETTAPPLWLSGERLFYGWYVNELLYRLLPKQDPQPLLFAYYTQTLSQLLQVEHRHEAEPILRTFEKNLLEELGYGLYLPDDLQPDRHYLNSLTWPECRADHAYALLGAHLIALRDEMGWNADNLRTSKKVLRQRIDRLLGVQTLKTPALFRRVLLLPNPLKESLSRI
jgi:DNA repair protein RecO (recombination protein O)